MDGLEDLVIAVQKAEARRKLALEVGIQEFKIRLRVKIDPACDHCQFDRATCKEDGRFFL